MLLIFNEIHHIFNPLENELLFTGQFLSFFDEVVISGCKLTLTVGDPVKNVDMNYLKQSHFPCIRA